MRRASTFLSLAVALGLASGSAVWRAQSAAAKQTPRTLQWRRTGQLIPERVFSMTSLGAEIFAGTSGGVFRSRDRGATWEQVNSLAALNVPVFRNYPLTVSGTRLLVRATDLSGNTGGVYFTDDRGQSWRQSSLTSTLAGAFGVNGATLVTQLVPETAVANGNYPIYRSTDGGQNWQARNNFAFSARALAYQGTTLFAGTQLPGGIRRSTDHGETWDTTAVGIAPRAVLKLAATDATLLAYVANTGSLSPYDVQISTNGGQTFSRIDDLPVGNVVRDFAVSGTTVFAAIENRGVYASANSGVNWALMNDGLTNTLVQALTISNGQVFVAAPAVGALASEVFVADIPTNCAYALNPANQAFNASGGAGSVGVSSGAGCAWTAVSNDAWLTITNGASGAGNGTVAYAVSANTGPTRTGTLTIAGQSFTVNQANGCAYALTPTSQSFEASGGAGTVQIATANGCGWTAASNDPWLTITNGASGSGPGSGPGNVGYNAAAYTGTGTRTGSLTIAGLSFSVTQTGVALNPAPALNGLNPNLVLAGSEAFTLEVNGSNFVSGSLVRWNGSARVTNFVSSTRLTAALPANDVAVARAVEITVFTPAPGGGTSNTLNLQINNPVPAVSSLSPNAVTAGSPGLTLTVNGANFVTGAAVRWNGAERTTTFVSRAQLTVALSSADFASAGTANVEVFNPAPGGGVSNLSVFTIAPPSPVCPVFGALTPASGPVGTRVTITGANFSSVTQVKFAGGVNAQFTLAGDTQLSVTVPSGAQSGPLALSKPGCADVLTAGFSVPNTSTISGAVTYSLTGAPVAAVLLTARNALNGAEAASNATTGAGRYALTNLVPGSYFVTPQKSGEVNGLSALDAALILRRAQGRENFNPAQLLAGDINRDTIISEADATILLRQLVGLPDSGPAGGQAGVWRFTPPNRPYEGLQGNQFNQDYQAILSGEVTGNWKTGLPAPFAITGIEAQPAALLVRGAQFQPGLTLVIGLPAGGEWRLRGAQLQNLRGDSFSLPFSFALPGLWTLQAVNPAGEASPPFSFRWPFGQ